MKKSINTNKISKIIKESASTYNKRSNKNLIESKKIGNTTFGLIKEFNTYIVKSTKRNGELFVEDFNYINGEQNRSRFMRSNLAEARRFFNFYLSEQQRNPLLKEDDDKYVIKQDVPEQEPDVDVDLDAEDMDVDVDQEEETEEIEADLEEYQELTGKLAYILRQVEDDKKDDVTKYVFNSLIAAMPEVSEDVSSSIKEKIEAELEDGDADQGEEVEDEELNESLKNKGFIVSEKFTKEEALAFFGAKDNSGIFVQKPTRFYDGKTKEPHMNKGVHKKGSSEPFEDNPASTSKNHPYDEKKKKKKGNKDAPFTEKSFKKKVNEDRQMIPRKKRARKTKLSSDAIARYKQMQLKGENGKLASILLRNALMKHGGPKAVKDGEASHNYIFAYTFLKSASKKDTPTQLVDKAKKLAKNIIRREGLSVLREQQLNEAFTQRLAKKVELSIDKRGVDETARSIFNLFVRNRMGGLDTSDLPDTVLLSDILDHMRDLLESEQYEEAFKYAKQNVDDFLNDATDGMYNSGMDMFENKDIWQDIDEENTMYENDIDRDDPRTKMGPEDFGFFDDEEEQYMDDETIERREYERDKYFSDLEDSSAPRIEEMLKDEFIDI